MRRIALSRWTIQVVATTGFILIALLRVDLEDVGAALERADYWWAAAAILALTLSRLIAAARWQLYLKSVAKVPLPGLMAAYVIGTFLNTVLPFRAGDFAKIQIVASRYGLPRSALGSSVFVVEAVLDVVTVLGLLLVGLAFLDVGYIPALVLWPFVFVGGGLFVAAVLASHLLPREPPFTLPSVVPMFMRDALRNAWPGLLDGMAALRTREMLSKAFSLHVAEWLLRALSLYLFGLSFELDTDPSTYLVLIVAISIFTFFPVTFMNIGTYQVVVTEVMGAAGVPRSEAFAYAVTAQALSHFWVIVMGLVAMWTLQVWPRETPTSQFGRDPEA